MYVLALVAILEAMRPAGIPGHCPRCQYDRRDLPCLSRCPECGTDRPPVRPPPPPLRPHPDNPYASTLQPCPSPPTHAAPSPPAGPSCRSA
jgi:hypothetical protein